MLIEVGQKYINESGDVVEIVLKDNYPFGTAFDKWYTKDGLYQSGKESREDLICLVDKNILKQYEANEITQKEFIAKHIELYTGKKL